MCQSVPSQTSSVPIKDRLIDDLIDDEAAQIMLGYMQQINLETGERVVTQGAFKIDSALQIKAKPSMMSGTGRGARGEGQTPGFISFGSRTLSSSS